MPSASLNVIQTVASTRSAHGGPSRSVPLLCESLAERGVVTRLLSGPLSPSDEVLRPADPVQTVHAQDCGPVDRRLRSPVGFHRTLTKQIRRSRPDLLHDHGVWLPTNAVAAWVAHREDIPLVISTRGMLTPWALDHNPWKKRLAWWAYQKYVLLEAALFHVTSREEVEALRSLGLHQPAAQIPNGVPFPDLSGKNPVASTTHRALFLSRVHPKKGLPMLIDVWATVNPEGWELVIVGPSEGGHRAELEERVRQLDLQDVVSFAGPVADEEKWSEYQKADLFILPTYSENFGIVVAEALATGCPVLTTTGTPWQELKTHRCGWWVEPRPPSVAQALRDAVGRSDEQRRRMGERGRALVENKYSWTGVAKKMERVYRWIQREGAPPHFVHLGP